MVLSMELEGMENMCMMNVMMKNPEIRTEAIPEMVSGNGSFRGGVFLVLGDNDRFLN
jgi:hypothetical protein